MPEADLLATAAAADFHRSFGTAPEAIGHAPGRVNLLGEHTDYNDGFVLPIAIAQRTVVGLGRAKGGCHELQAADLGERTRFTDEALPESASARFAFGCLREAGQWQGRRVPPLNIHLHSTVPMGVGLSSSAALNVALLRALRMLLQAPWDDVEIAQRAQRVERMEAGVNCGIMDPMACSLAGTDRALFLDTRSLERRFVPLPPGGALLVLDSGVARQLAGSGYNQRRAECEAAAKALGVEALRDIEDPAAVEHLSEPLRRRARHVITENARVLAAANGPVTAWQFGGWMNQSHASLRDDFEVTVPALDRLAERLQAHPAVYGARMTGAGFGGACVALVEAGEVERVAVEVVARCGREGMGVRRLVPA